MITTININQQAVKKRKDRNETDMAPSPPANINIIISKVRNQGSNIGTSLCL